MRANLGHTLLKKVGLGWGKLELGMLGIKALDKFVRVGGDRK